MKIFFKNSYIWVAYIVFIVCLHQMSEWHQLSCQCLCLSFSDFSTGRKCFVFVLFQNSMVVFKYLHDKLRWKDTYSFSLIFLQVNDQRIFKQCIIETVYMFTVSNIHICTAQSKMVHSNMKTLFVQSLT